MINILNINDIPNSDIEHKEEVVKQSEKAIRYLTSFKWCKEILNGWLIEDYGYILCMFRFDIYPVEGSGADSKIWIIVGDIPSAYLDVDSYPTANDALSFYCYLMEEWIEHVRNGKSIDDCYPVNVPPTEEFAEMLETRIALLKSDYLPYL